MIKQHALILVGLIAAACLLGATARAAEDYRMRPAQRLLHDGAKPSQRDLARGKVRRATAIRTRGRVYDEIRPASATANWQAKRPTRASRSVRKRR